MYRYSGISLERLLTLETLRGAKILGGATGTSKRVTKVNVMEVPDIIEWVSEGEFLITTAYSIKDNINILLELIPKLNAKGVAGLGIKVGRYVSELPRDVIKLADELGFPLIEVPFAVSHTDVISGILTEVINDQMNMLIRINVLNREVMNIMMMGGSLREIAQKLYENIGNSLAIYENMSDSCEVICNEDDRNIIDNIIYEHISLNHIEDINYYDEVSYKVHRDEIRGRVVERVVIPIVIENVEYGCIFVWFDKKDITPLDNMLIESYVHIIALDFVKKLSLYNMESNYKLEFFDDLLSDNEDRQKRAIERAKTFNFYKNLKYSVIVILLRDIDDSNKLTADKVNSLHERISEILFITGRVAKLQKERIVYVDKSDRILILYGSERSKSPQTIKSEAINFCQKILDEALKKFVVNMVTIGIGRSYDECNQLYKSREQAKLIVENLSKTNTRNIKHYDDLGLYRILAFEGLQGELSEFCSDTIKPLIEYDKINNAELIKTLKAYFECDGNMKKISEKMYMHYNTIIYRVQQINDITGLDLENGDSRLNLEIALKAMDLIKI
ncbi:PucR family transcriptional regulator ligand-binding domain-containing protein [Clostridium bowmanii]|uniref:PucR family transcriptional regulator n=1 Tax=Clostridium bowmanii TaxID=132925 RepID=UPI001C0D3957|nr:PucR family transcriptional regulator [Clostridium bowmanii]MBU3191349.1 PucR family transcriptional regulator ligand-binding domain-containing protein [Clostridium bowmanii]MCA1073462.1 PucR family transcriptional regulator ligand-binding domain-containing protein [Clostridium bowmanii]